MSVLAGEVLPAAAGPGREVATGGRDQLAAAIDAWLLRVARSEHTVRGYRSDLALWLAWCDRLGVYPLDVHRSHLDAWLRVTEHTPTRTGRPPAEATLARRVASVASFYGFAVDEGLTPSVPVGRRGRPKAPNVSTSSSLSRDEAIAIRRRLVVESPLDRAVVLVLLLGGVRVGELGALNVGSVGYDSGHVVLRVQGKGRRVRTTVLAGPVVEALDGLLGQRAAEAGVPVEDLDQAAPLLPNRAGGRLTQQQVTRIVKRVARGAGVRGWRQVTPHVFRHAFITLALDNGAALHVVADHAGHASVSTTKRYDRARGALSRTPVHGLAAFTEPEPEQGGR